MDLIKFDNIESLYPEGVEGLFRDAFESYISKGRYWEYYYNELFPRLHDKQWVNFSHLVRIINAVAQKESFGFDRKEFDNHKIIIQGPSLTTKHLPCALCEQLAGKMISFQDFVCDMPLSKLKCCNPGGRCQGYYDLIDSNNEIIQDKRITIESGRLRLYVKTNL